MCLSIIISAAAVAAADFVVAVEATAYIGVPPQPSHLACTLPGPDPSMRT